MAKAKNVCETCGAGFRSRYNNTKNCPAHRYTKPLDSDPIDDTGGRTWVPGAKIKLADKVQQWLYAHDAENECRHGALPHDKVLPKGCKCWGERYPFEEPEQAESVIAKKRKVA